MLSYLSVFENQIPESLYLEGESLYDSIAAPTIVKEKANLYLINLVDGKDTLDIEVQFINKKSIKSNCVCKAHKKDKNCKHVVASLFAIRKMLAAKPKPAPKPRATKSKATDFQRIIQEISKSDLENFIKLYARKNLNFKLELEAHFASKVDFEDNETKYKSVLNRVVKAKSSSHPKLSGSSLTTFKKIMSDFWAQSNDMFSLDRFDEVFYACRFSLEKLYYSKNIYLLEHDFIDEYINNFVSLMGKLLTKELAPEFRDKIKTNYLDFATYSFVIPMEENHVHDLIFQSMDLTQEETNVLLDDIKIKLLKLEDYRGNQILAKVIAGYANNDSKYEWINAHYSVTRIIKAMSNIGKADINNYFEILNKLEAEYTNIPEISFIKIRDLIRNEWFDIALKEFLNVCKEQKQIQRLIPFFSLVPTDLLNKSTKKFAKALAKYPSSLQVKFFSQYNEHEQIIRVIKEHNDMTLMMEQDHDLIDIYEEEINDFYVQWTQQYLKEHIGSKSKERIQEIQNHLKTIGAKKIVSNVKKAIDLNFTHRKNVILID